MNLGNTITRLREAKGLKQKTLAEQSTITQAYLSQIENNKKEPNLSTLRDISGVLGIPVPLIFFLSMDDKDLPEAKKDAFNILSPLMRNLISDFFVDQKLVG